MEASGYPQGALMADKTCMPANVVQDDVVLFAVPKKGRIHEDVMKLLKGAGLDAKRPDRLDVAMCKELPVKLVFLPAADIPSYVMEGNVDLGISGSDMLEETVLEEGHAGHEEANVTVLRKLGIGKCKLCLEAPKVLNLNKDPTPLVGKKIVTSFPYLAGRFFSELEAKTGSSTKTSIKVVSGSVEAACGLGLADAVVDLVETGTTMQAAGLEVVSDIFETEALLFKQKNVESTSQATRKAEIIETMLKRIDGYMTSTRFVMVIYNCHRDSLQECCKITPGKRSPTVTELKEEGWHSVSSLVPREKMNSVMDELTKAGAVDVLCTGLVNTRM
jgi:ATP phosphoribosyltransferase